MIQERGKGVCASDKYQIEDQGEQKFSSIGSWAGSVLLGHGDYSSEEMWDFQCSMRSEERQG